MPADRLEIVRRTADYWNRRDWSEMEAVLEAEVTVVPPAGWPEGDTIRGWPDWKRQIERLKDSWEEEHVEVEDVTPVGDRVLVKYMWTTRGKDSGIPFETPMWTVFTFSDDRIAGMQYFMDEALAVEAADPRE